jgi:DNA-binding MarR family transcriptional regulator
MHQQVAGLPIDYDAMSVVTNIRHAFQAIKLAIERSLLREFDLTWAGFSTLVMVWTRGPIETRDIARLQGVSRATVTSNITLLERHGLVERRTSVQDRRLVLVELTLRRRLARPRSQDALGTVAHAQRYISFALG